MGEACTKSENAAEPQRSRPPTIEHRVSGASGSRKSTRGRLNTGDETYAIAHAQAVLTDAYKSDVAVIRTHIKNGFPVDFPLNAQGWTLIHVAAQTGNMPLAQLLLEHDCDVDTEEVAEGWTPLMIAAINNMADVAELLQTDFRCAILRKPAKNFNISCSYLTRMYKLF